MTICSEPICDLPISSTVHMERTHNGEVFQITLTVKPVIQVTLAIDI